MVEVSWDWLAGINLLQVCLVVLTVGLIVRMLVRFWPWLRKVVELTSALSQLPEFITRTDSSLQEQNRKISEIHHEVNYNNGGSVKDAVARVEQSLKEITDANNRS